MLNRVELQSLRKLYIFHMIEDAEIKSDYENTGWCKGALILSYKSDASFWAVLTIISVHCKLLNAPSIKCMKVSNMCGNSALTCSQEPYLNKCWQTGDQWRQKDRVPWNLRRQDPPGRDPPRRSKHAAYQNKELSFLKEMDFMNKM